MTSTAIAFLERFYKVSFVKCLFVGSDQKVRSSHDVGLRPSDPIKVADVINQASLARFGVACGARPVERDDVHDHRVDARAHAGVRA